VKAPAASDDGRSTARLLKILCLLWLTGMALRDLYGRRVYSFLDRRPIETFGGLRYRGSCWGIRLVLRDSISSRSAVTNPSGQRDTGWYLQLELKGLSSVGSAADSFLLSSIQGYSPTSSNH